MDAALDIATYPSMYPVKLVPIADLRAHEANYLKHDPSQIASLVKSLEEFGQVKPIVIWHNTIIAGHGVTEAAQFLRWKQILAVVLPEEWDEMKARGYLVADNRLAQLASVDKMQLTMLLEEQQQSGRDLVALGSSDSELEALTKATERSIQVEGLMGTELDRCPTCGQLYKPQKKGQPE